MNMIHYLLIALVALSCIQTAAKGDELKWTKPDLKGHWRLYDTKIVDEVPFLNLHATEPDPMKAAREDSPWDSYTAFDLVFEDDSIYRVHYPIEAFSLGHYFLDSGYLHLRSNDGKDDYPAELVNDTLILYRALRSDPGYFKEKYLKTNFNDSILNVIKMHGTNYPELAGTWHLVREEDYDYGTHFELHFPHSIPDSIKFSRKQMLSALEGKRVYMMLTDGVKRDYSFSYRKGRIDFTPGKWYKGEDPWLHFER